MFTTKLITYIILPTLLFSGSISTSYAQGIEIVSPTEVEVEVRAAFADMPDMIEIARCESNFRQFTDAGNVLRGGAGGQMVGVFQFYESVHSASAARLGYDLATLEGNIDYARHLSSESGTTPWNSSADCWQGVRTSPTYTLTSDTTAAATKEELLREKISLLTQLLTLLQTLLALQMSE